MAKEYFVVTAIGPDRRGIVAKITAVLVGLSANIEESSMERLGGEFAAMLLISVNNSSRQQIEAALAQQNQDQVHIFVKQTDLSRGKIFEGFVPYQISVIGADHEGIINSVSEYLATVKIQIEEMDTEVVPAPITGTPLFTLSAEVQVPPEIRFSELEENLLELGDELGVEIEVKQAGVI
jgi:glycine cleavage system transcriptional repressor